MADRDIPQKSADYSSTDRLVAAMISLWERHGNASISLRMVAQMAEIPVSSIYHHFGTMEHLSLTAQDAACVLARHWCERRLADLATARFPADALPALIAALIDEWTQGERRLAFAHRECQVMAARDPRYMPALRAWQDMWSSFWHDLSARCDTGAFSTATTSFFYGESALHLLRWRRAIDRACLDETCRAWGEWLAGCLAAEGPWRRFARDEARDAAPELSSLPKVAQQIADAAADTIEEHGMGGLTHRAVAHRAGLTLGVVSYNFKTSADLTRAAFEAVYQRVAPQLVDGARPIPTAAEALESVAGYDIHAPNITVIDEVMAAVARDPDLIAFAPQLRYSRGRSSGVQLQALVGDRPISTTDAALFSTFASGQRVAALTLPAAEAAIFRRRGLADLLARLGAPVG